MGSYPGLSLSGPVAPNAHTEQYTSRGYRSRKAGAPRPSSSSAPGRRFWMRTSASPINSMSQATAALSLRSTVIDRLLALTARNPGDTPFQNGGPQRRASSPSGRSTLITSAPRWARISPATGPARFWPISTTRIPSSVIGRALAR